MDKKELNFLLEELLEYKTEQPWLEFKVNRGSITNHSCGEYISAISNSACVDNKDYGYLVCGVDDKTHEIKGSNFFISKGKEGNQDLELWLRTGLFPKIHFEFFEFDYKGKQICLIKIPAAKGEPTYFMNRCLVRINSNNQLLTKYPEYARKIYNSMKDWSAQIVLGAKVSDLDETALKAAREKFIERNPKQAEQAGKWDIKTLLDKLNITIDGKITNTALILLWKPEASHYLLPSVIEITWALDTEEKSYQHLGMPVFVNINKVLERIRNVKYKFFPDNQLISIEKDKYETEVILEALNNCIAHQDYSKNERIILTEKIDRLIFENAGNFIEGTVDDYSLGKKTPTKYRNKWLAQAMFNLGMIDAKGYGINKMFMEQRKRYFPLPDYIKSTNDRVVLEIYGCEIDKNYSKLLIEKSDLELETVIWLDKIQKKQDVEELVIKNLKKSKLIEGRKPNYYVSFRIADITDTKEQYIRNKGFDDIHYEGLIFAYIKKFERANRKDINNLILGKLPEILRSEQKMVKINNLLKKMREKNLIENIGPKKISLWKIKGN